MLLNKQKVERDQFHEIDASEYWCLCFILEFCFYYGGYTLISGSFAGFLIAQHAIEADSGLEMQSAFWTGKKVLKTLKCLSMLHIPWGLKQDSAIYRSKIKKHWKGFVAFHCLNHSLQPSVSQMPP